MSYERRTAALVGRHLNRVADANLRRLLSAVGGCRAVPDGRDATGETLPSGSTGLLLVCRSEYVYRRRRRDPQNRTAACNDPEYNRNQTRPYIKPLEHRGPAA